MELIAGGFQTEETNAHVRFSASRSLTPLSPVRFILGGSKCHTGYRFDPDEMVMHLFDAGNILSGDDESFTLAIIGDDPP
jgi:hypothetical protein